MTRPPLDRRAGAALAGLLLLVGVAGRSDAEVRARELVGSPGVPEVSREDPGRGSHARDVLGEVLAERQVTPGSADMTHEFYRWLVWGGHRRARFVAQELNTFLDGIAGLDLDESASAQESSIVEEFRMRLDALQVNRADASGDSSYYSKVALQALEEVCFASLPSWPASGEQFTVSEYMRFPKLYSWLQRRKDRGGWEPGGVQTISVRSASSLETSPGFAGSVGQGREADLEAAYQRWIEGGGAARAWLSSGDAAPEDPTVEAGPPMASNDPVGSLGQN